LFSLIFFCILLVRGVANDGQAGAVSTIAAQASKIFPEDSDSPIICLESDKRYTVIVENYV